MDPNLIIAIRALMVPLLQQARAEAKAATSLDAYDLPCQAKECMEEFDNVLLEYQAKAMQRLKPATEPKANTGGDEG
jgi:hypothetical protein